jgi:dTDP-4-amino-4,6-dideoxygalactose transaminase
MKKLNLTEMYVDEDMRQAAIDVLNSGRYIKGPRVQDFEEEFAKFTKAQFGIATSSGTTALFTSYLALGFKPGDEVILPSHTFIATATPLLFLGVKPVFVDIDPETFCMDPEDVKKKITDKTKGIVAVHLYGHSVDLQPILDLAKKHELKVIEDSCQAHGAKYQNHNIGDIGDVAVFSFFPSKNMTVAGDGGICVTNNPDLADKMKIIRNHGRTDRDTSQILGLNFRMSELHAAIGMVQLKRLPDWIVSRRNVASIYNRFFGESDLVNKGKIILPIERDWAKHVYHLYVIRVLNGKRDELRKHLQNHGINTGIHYGKAIHEQPVIIDYLRNEYDETIYPDDFPETNKAIKEILSLPMHPELSVEDITRIVDSMKSFFRRN